MSEPSKNRWRAVALILCALLALGAGDASDIPPAEQLRRLEETGLAQARKAIETKQDLWPFAFVVREDGRTQRLTTKKSRRRRGVDASAPLIEGLRSRAASGAYRAVAVFRFVVITLPSGEKSHAIYAGTEHVSGRCAEVFVPYHETDAHQIRFQSELRRSRSPEIFQRCDPLGASEP